MTRLEELKKINGHVEKNTKEIANGTSISLLSRVQSAGEKLLSLMSINNDVEGQTKRAFSQTTQSVIAGTLATAILVSSVFMTNDVSNATKLMDIQQQSQQVEAESLEVSDAQYQINDDIKMQIQDALLEKGVSDTNGKTISELEAMMEESGINKADINYNPTIELYEDANIETIQSENVEINQEINSFADNFGLNDDDSEIESDETNVLESAFSGLSDDVDFSVSEGTLEDITNPDNFDSANDWEESEIAEAEIKNTVEADPLFGGTVFEANTVEEENYSKTEIFDKIDNGELTATKAIKILESTDNLQLKADLGNQLESILPELDLSELSSVDVQKIVTLAEDMKVAQERLGLNDLSITDPDVITQMSNELSDTFDTLIENSGLTKKAELEVKGGNIDFQEASQVSEANQQSPELTFE